MVQLDIKKLEERRIAEGLPKYRMSEIAGSRRDGLYFDLLKHDGWMRNWQYVTNFVKWYGNRDIILKLHRKRGINRGSVV